MKSIRERLFDYNLPINERLLYLATLMCSVLSLLLALFSIAFNLISFAEFAVLIVIFVISSVVFFLEFKFRKTKMYAHLFLFFINFILFPIAYILSDAYEFEIPVYALIGLVYALVLTNGRARFAHFASQVVIVLSIFIYRFFSLKNNQTVFEGLSYTGFVKAEVAIFITSILIGATILYRNLCIQNDLSYRNKLNEEAEMTSYAKDMFLVNVSHEIRTPLNAIIGTTNIVLDSDADNHIKETASNIYNASNALLSITNDLLDFSSMATDEIVLSEDSYDISLLLKDIINLVSVSVLDQGFDFYAWVNPSLPKMIIGDSSKLRQVITNLLFNACKHTKEGAVTLTVDYEHISDYELKLIIAIEDTGSGMESSKVESLFNDNTDNKNINVTGLSLVKRISDAMGADISVSSEPGKGSKFVFTAMQRVLYSSNMDHAGDICEYPSICFFLDRHYETKRLEETLDSMKLRNTEVYSDNAFVELCKEGYFDYYFIDSDAYRRVKDKLAEKKIDWKKLVVITSCNYAFYNEPFEYVLTRPVNCLNLSDLINKYKSYSIKKISYGGSFDISKAKILVVDDNLINLDVTEGLLSRFNCKVVKANSGNEGIMKIKNDDIDLVLLDYMMPEMDGIDTLKIIRNMDDGKYKDLAVIAFTANAVSGARERFMSEGFNDYISKPIDMDKLSRIFLENIPSDKVEYIV